MTPDNPATRRTLARLRLARMHLRRQGKLTLAGAPVTWRETDVRATWMRAGWKPGRVTP